MERPGKRVQEIPEDPREQLKLALQGKIDTIQINNFVYRFEPDDYDILDIFELGRKVQIGFYNLNTKSLETETTHLKIQLKDEIGIPDNFWFYNIRINEERTSVIVNLSFSQRAKEFSERFANAAVKGSIVIINDAALGQRLVKIVKMYYEPFLVLLKAFNPAFVDQDFFVTHKLKLRIINGPNIDKIMFKQFPSLNKLAWKKLTPEKQREFNIYAPNECRICQKPTEVMCSLTKIPFCSKECQMKYF